jgi:hypothetical protein
MALLTPALRFSCSPHIIIIIIIIMVAASVV